MLAQSEFLSQLQTQSHDTFQRRGVAIYGEPEWQDALITDFYKHQSNQTWFCVGDCSLEGAFCVSGKQGNMLLGRECDVLLFDARSGVDANSFTAALGALVGGGLLLVIANKPEHPSEADLWMQMHWQKLTVIDQSRPLPKLSSVQSGAKENQFEQQIEAVALVEKVVTGHRKRPLVLTADRGRGKTSALGIACAELLERKPMRILVTAPNIKAVEPVYQHALRLLSTAQRVKKDRLEAGQGYIQFIAPDELLCSLPDCDLLLIDEAAAIPVPMLKQITEHYHRLVFSSTIHGYEGCGRGFTLKFVEWLKEQRPGMKSLHLQQPIRWSANDKLETWLYEAFLLNAELEAINVAEIGEIALVNLRKSELISNPSVLNTCFALLVNAHYQTSPSDLLHLLQDECSQIYVALHNSDVVGVMMTVEEGNLDENLVKEIQLGRRRPKGHLAPVSIINQLGYPEVGALSTLRVMRIAVHPEFQGQGIGQQMLAKLEEDAPSHISYLSTSFGATSELIRFWQRSGFDAIRLGTMRDAASGCYSLLMIRQCSPQPYQGWIEEAKALFEELISLSASSIYPRLEPSLIRSLFFLPMEVSPLNQTKLSLIEHYACGGNSFESVSVWLQQWLWQNGLDEVSDLMISKLLLNQDWSQCARQYGLLGRKQVESTLRSELQVMLAKFTV
ncbi:DEAD/DEAH box helicase [Vibrio rotiferianus]|uniref:GNAT family N-acetyltransferase n=1 Tax=Vibrio rotiferianus TaxID=190895 RepID=UPI00111080A7|nr:GNAT family N-acetyltransferase [Vibrio rotiferianus]TMX43889.1 DEAD/DEAH box helicase [Vibrio rotiferianus]TMX61275.1 DEAD/DEAH box helicase [Vibrio rotiferianus]TMX69490.1 DEAD/DEAH box helicase [Vibrio rotiferianus]